MKKQSIDYEAELEALPPGLDKSVGKAIAKYSDVRPMKRGELISTMAMLGYVINDEKDVRDAIHRLRNKGFLICARSGKNGGYWLAKTMEEYFKFRQKEFISKISDMSTTVKVMDAAARARFGDGVQLGLPI